MKGFKRYFVVGESPSSYLKPLKFRSKAPYSPCGKKSGAVGPLLRCHKYSKLGHTANQCRSNEKFPHTRARELNEFTEVTEIMGCFNCGREGYLAKNCRQGKVCKKCGMNGHPEKNCRVQKKTLDQVGKRGWGVCEQLTDCPGQETIGCPLYKIHESKSHMRSWVKFCALFSSLHLLQRVASSECISYCLCNIPRA